MHWSQAVLLFCGSAAAAPLSIGLGSTGTTGVTSTSSSVGASVGGVGICIGLGGTSGCGSSSATTSTTPSTGVTSGSTSSSVGTTSGSTGSTTSSGTSAATSPKTSVVPSTSGTTGTTVGTTGSTGSTVGTTGSTVGTTGSTTGANTGTTGTTPVTGTTVSSGTTAATSPKVSVPVTGSTTATVTTGTSGDFTTTQVNTIITDLNNFDAAISSAQSALNAFTGGTSDQIKTQASNVATAGDHWQTTIVQLLKDAQALLNKGHFSAADSKTITSTISGAITTDLVNLFTSIKGKHALFASAGSVSNVYNGLTGIRDELKAICDNLTPELLTADYPTLQIAGTKIYSAAQDAITAYAS